MSNKDKFIEETKLWEHITKDIVPLKNKNKTKIVGENNKSSISKKHTDRKDHFISKNTGSVTNSPYVRSSEIDRNTERRLKRGQIAIDGRLDLHGMTQNQAYDALLSFIPSAYYTDKRCVLIITGKGDRQGSHASMIDKKVGILKQKTPVWLNSHPLNEYILNIKTARPNHGGEGALYVLLRKNRK